MTTPTTTPDLRSATEIEVQPFITRGVRRITLPNGLTVITKEMHDRPVVATILWYRVGSRNEELGQTGKSHFLEHMLFKGTDRYKKGEIDLITVSNGGANNAFTWLDFTAYYFTLASDRWEVTLEIEANRMRNTTFAQEEFDSEKQVVEEELRIGLDGPWEALENEVWATAFRQHPYHWPTVGWLGDLETATAADMKAYYDKWYHPRNATLVIVGDFDTAEVHESVEQLFGSIPAGPEPQALSIVEPPQRGEKRVVVKKDSPVERMLIAYHAPEVAHPDSYALSVAESVLSTGKTSRLYRRLVERDQSVTMVNASYNSHIDPSLFYIQAEVKPGFTLPEVELAIYDEIDRLSSEPISDAELEKAKRQLEADIVFSTEEPLQQAILLGQFETIAFRESIPEESRGYRYLETLMDRIREVGAEDVVRVARKYFDQDNRTVGYLLAETNRPAAESGDEPIETASGLLHGLEENVSFRTGALTGPNAVDAPLRPPSGKEEFQRPKLDVERVELPNGIVLLLSENHTTPSVSINAVVMTGARYETDDQAGLASLVGDLLDEGTRTRTGQEIAESVESVGGRLRTFGDYQVSGVQASFLSKDLWLGLDIVADVLMNAAFPQEKVEQYIARRVAQIKSRLDVPRVQASDLFNEIVFKGHPLHKPSVGYEETVSRLTRDQVLEFYRSFYVPERTILAIVGDFQKAEIKSSVEQSFGGWESEAAVETPPINPPARQTKSIERFVTAHKEQVNIYIGHIGIERKNPDYYALLVMDTILGSSPGFTSRIPRILRDEQGLAYTTFSNMTMSAGIDPGRFIAYIGTSPENLDRAISGLRGEIARMVSEPVTAEELEIATSYLTGNFVFNFQTNAQIASFLVEAEVYGLGFDYLEKYPQLIRAVSAQEVARVARKHLDPERMTTVVVGPVDENGSLIEKH